MLNLYCDDVYDVNVNDWFCFVMKYILIIIFNVSYFGDRGRLAQLAARMLSMHKVAGSIPAMSSTDNNNPVQNQDASFFLYDPFFFWNFKSFSGLLLIIEYSTNP